MPVYDVLIDTKDPNKIYTGTDLGVYSTTNGGDNWNYEGPEKVPAMMIKQEPHPLEAD